MSFALCRPDALGAHFYHNRVLLALADNESAIITPMVDFAKTIRKVAVCVYTSSRDVEQSTHSTSDIEIKLDRWLLLLHTRPNRSLMVDQ